MFHIVFYAPCIPPNTGNAIRLVAATGAMLHLVEPLGFDISAQQVRRAGLDYHSLASVIVHKDLPSLWQYLPTQRVFAFTTSATQIFSHISYQPGDILLFGPEPHGLDEEVLSDPRITSQVRIPMLEGRRSLNLSNAAAIANYEAWRQQGFYGGY